MHWGDDLAKLTIFGHEADDLAKLIIFRYWRDEIGSYGIRLPYFHCEKGGQVFMRVITSKKKVITSADVQFSDQNQMKTKKKKKVSTPSDVKFSPQSPDCTFCDMVWGPASRDGAHPFYVRIPRLGGAGGASFGSVETSQNFQGRIIGHVFTVHDAEKEDFWTFFGVLGGQFFW